MVDSTKELEIPFMYRKLMSPEEQTAVIRSFKNFDKSGDGFIETGEFANLIKDMGRTDISAEKVAEIFKKYDTDSDGKIDFMEYLDMCVSLAETKTDFGRQSTKNDKQAMMESETGGHHSYLFEERNTYARLFNSVLAKDEYVGERFPIDPESDDLWHVMADGMVFIRLLCCIDKDAVFMGAVNKGKGGVVNIFETRQNIQLGLSAAKGMIKLVGTDASTFLEKKPHMLLGICWQLARLVAVKKIELKDCPELFRLLNDGETIEDLMKLPPEDILVRWINYHLRQAGQDDKQVKNLGKDLKDSQAMSYVLNQLDKQNCPMTKKDDPDMLERGKGLMNESKAMKVPEVVTAEDWIKGNTKVNTIYVAEVFNTKHGLDPLDKEEMDKLGLMDDDPSGTREERQFRLWINSLELDGVQVNNLYEDCRDGMVLLKVIHKIDPNVVEWNRVEKNANTVFKIGINCQVAIDACHKLGVKLIGIGAVDIQQANKKLVLAIVWQLMRKHYQQIIGNKDDKVIIAWGNTIAGNEEKQIKGFKDANLKDGVYLINLLAAIEPRIIDWDLVSKDTTDEEKLAVNAKYAISIARKLGAIIFMVWEDVLEMNSKMMTIFISSVYDLWMEAKGQKE